MSPATGTKIFNDFLVHVNPPKPVLCVLALSAARSALTGRVAMMNGSANYEQKSGEQNQRVLETADASDRIGSYMLS